MKYIEIDGVKYKVDPNDPTKALEIDGVKQLYVEDTPPPVPPTPTPVPKPSDYDKLSDEEIDELAKEDPALAQLIRKNRELADTVTERERVAEEERQETLRKNGEFQTIAEEEVAKRKAAEDKNRETESILDKHKESLREIRDDMLGQVPEDKKTLIPNGSPRSQIDYMRTNAEFLGVTLISKGAPVPDNDDTPPLDEEGKLNKEFTDLVTKIEKTQTEKDRMGELAKLIKEIRARKT